MSAEPGVPTPVRVVLLRDGRWPSLPGVCCWRHSVRAAFTAAGANVAETTCLPALSQEQPGTPPQLGRDAVPVTPQRLPWLPSAVRRLLRAGYRAGRSAARALRQSARRSPGAATPNLDGAAVVIAETVEAACLALDAGAPRRGVWVLALPPQRLSDDDAGGPGPALAEVAHRVGGFLVDSDTARDSVERATAHTRPAVIVFPPIAVDRPCPECGPTVAETPASLPASVAQLVAWQAMLRGEPSPESTPLHSFAQWRLAGGQWSPMPLSPWGDSALARHDVGEPAKWTVDEQIRGAQAVLAAVTPQPPRRPRPTKSVLLSGHDLKFARDLAARLDQRTDLDVVVDEWPHLSYRNRQTTARLRRADAIFAEWARTSAVWLSAHKRPGQFLAVRLHRFELDSPYPRRIAIDNVDAVVYIAPLFGRRIRDELGWPADKLVYIPNFLDVDWLDRPKVPQARFTVGFVGVEWSRKRFDLALDLIAAARREDPRFTLVVRSVMPWHNHFAWRSREEREYATWCFERITHDPLLRDGVFFDPPGRDMARWYRRVGHILSTSDEEGSHTAVSEGMASGAVPLIRPWPGASELYGREWIHDSTDAAVAALLASADAEDWEKRAARAKAEVRRSHDPTAVVNAWADLLHGDVAGARTYFAEYLSGDETGCG